MPTTSSAPAVSRRRWLDRNLAALAARAPTLADEIRRGPDDGPGVEMETQAEAMAAVSTFQPKPGPGGMGPPVYVLQPCGADRLRALLTSRLGTRSRQPVVVVEPDARRLRAALSAGDWSQVIADARLRWAVGPDSVAACKASFGNDPCFWFEGASFVFGSAAAEAQVRHGPPQNHWKKFLAAAAADLQQTISNLEVLRQAWGDFRAARPPLAALPAGQARVFGVTDVNTTALKYIYRDLLDAAAGRGHPVTLHEEDYLSDPFRAHRRARAFLEAKPDLLLCLIQSGWQAFGAFSEGLPVAVYYSSDPDRYPLEAAKFTPLDHVFVADRAWVKTLAAHGAQARVLPLATSMHRAEIPADGEQWTCDAVMVGNLTGPNRVLPEATDTVLARISDLGEKLARDPTASADELARRSSFSSPGEGDREIARAIEVAATYALRRRAAVVLAEAGIDLRIYGNEQWAVALKGTAAAGCYRRPLDYRSEVPAAYHHAAVVVNVSSVNAPEALNMRAFDVPAAGGCLVTDDRPGVRDAFEVGREVVVYKRLEDLPVIIGDLRADPAGRNAIAEAGRARVLASHTYDQRWTAILAACAASPSEGHP